MFARQNVLARIARRSVPLAILLLMASCARSPGPAPESSPQGDWRSFEGSWSAVGLRRTLTVAPGQQSSVFDLTGSVLLTGERRPAVGFQARVIGFSDERAGMRGRSVWTDERGDQVFSDLKGERTATGNRVIGTFSGGTGRYAGVSGEYSFEWKYLVESEDGAVSGRAVDLKGRALLGTAARAAPAARGDS